MQLLNLELDHFNFYCPATSDKILSEDDCNENSASFIGYWLDDFMTEPSIKNKDLKNAWETFLDEVDKQFQREPNFTEFESFLTNYPQPNWIIYKITTSGMACGAISSAVYHILDMNVVR